MTGMVAGNDAERVLTVFDILLIMSKKIMIIKIID